MNHNKVRVMKHNKVYVEAHDMYIFFSIDIYKHMILKKKGQKYYAVKTLNFDSYMYKLIL